MEYIITLVCVITAFSLATLSCSISNIHIAGENQKSDFSKKDNTLPKNPTLLLGAIKSGILGITAKQWTAAAVGAVLTGFACFKAPGFCADSIDRKSVV